LTVKVSAPSEPVVEMERYTVFCGSTRLPLLVSSPRSKYAFQRH
jgi:hypothetical protein